MFGLAGGCNALGLELIRKGGRYVQVGIFGKPVEADLDLILYKELSYSSGFASTPTSWNRALALLDSGDVRLDPLVSEVVPIADWERAFSATREWRGHEVSCSILALTDPVRGEQLMAHRPSSVQFG